jgi:uncharacterized damage-inducible protein DinB
MMRYTEWADGKLLAAADGITADQYGEIRALLAHMLGTQRWWYARWTAGEWKEPQLETLDVAKREYAASHKAIRQYVYGLTDEEWDRAEQWWLEWGFEGRMAVGESITQLYCHGVQHRAELAMRLTGWGHSPGDLDYLFSLPDTVSPRS